MNYTPVGGDDNHVLCISVGGGMGVVMLLNVWGIIWPTTRKSCVAPWPERLPPTPLNSRAKHPGFRTNLFLSVPLLFYMAAAAHFSSTVIFGK